MGDDSLASINGCCRVKLKLKDGRIITLPGMLHIPNIARNLIYVGKMDVASVKAVWIWWLQNSSRINGTDEGSSVWKFVNYWEELSLMNVTVLLCLRKEVKMTEP